MRSLRVRIALAAFAAVALILLLVGTLLVRGFERSERDALDARLRERIVPAARAAPLALPQGIGPELAPPDRVAPGSEPDRGGPPPIAALRGPPPGLFRGSDDATRLIAGGRVIGTLGDPRAASLPLPGRDGLQTVQGEGGRWRVLVMPAHELPGARVEVATSLAPLDDRVARLQQRLVLLGLAGLGGAAAAGWFFGAAALRSLERLRHSATSVSSTDDLSVRLPVSGGPDEVDDLATALNEMLARLQASSAETTKALESTRRFAADAGHELRTPLTSIGANIETLARNPNLPLNERTSVLAALTSEQARTVALLDALQALARGDAAAVMPRESLDLGELLDATIAAARARHPETEFSLATPESAVELEAWPQGLRLAIDNLLENAAVHGAGADRQVRTDLSADESSIRVSVADDGPGIPDGDRERIFERFQRGEGARGSGSGLGLALVAQQADLHGGEVKIDATSQGGARFTLIFPRRHEAGSH